MGDFVRKFAEAGAAIVEVVGIGVIIAVAIFSLVYLIFRVVKGVPVAEAYHRVRLLLAKGVLLGLEFLVAADIVHTVAVELTFETAGVLAVIVLIRTFLSFTIELELTGRWPWQRARNEQ